MHVHLCCIRYIENSHPSPHITPTAVFGRLVMRDLHLLRHPLQVTRLVPPVKHETHLLTTTSQRITVDTGKCRSSRQLSSVKCITHHVNPIRCVTHHVNQQVCHTSRQPSDVLHITSNIRCVTLHVNHQVCHTSRQPSDVSHITFTIYCAFKWVRRLCISIR